MFACAKMALSHDNHIFCADSPNYMQLVVGLQSESGISVGPWHALHTVRYIYVHDQIDSGVPILYSGIDRAHDRATSITAD